MRPSWKAADAATGAAQAACRGSGGALTLRLGYRPPLDLPAMLAFLQRRAIPGIEQVDASGYRRVIGTPGNATLIEVSAAPQRAELLLRIGATDPRQIPQIVRRVRRLFDLDADLQAVHATLAAEPLLAEAIARRPGLRVPGGWDGFEVAVRAVLGQQISVAGAATLAARLVDRHGGHHGRCRPAWTASFRLRHSWPKRRWNSSACRVHAPPRCVRWPRRVRKGGCISAPASACPSSSPPARPCPASGRGLRTTSPCVRSRIRMRFRPAT